MKRLLSSMFVLGVVGLLLIPTAASAQDGSRQDASLLFTERRPGVSTGVELLIDYVNPADPAAKPPAVRRVVVELAHGARYDTSVPALCPATDAELMAQGTAACPAGSIVGEGVITLDTGIPGPGRFIASDTTFFNNTNELIFLNTERQSGGHIVVRGEVGERTIVSEAPFLPGSPPDGTAIDTVQITDHAISNGSGNYITTPPRCPRSRQWINRVTFTYDDGVTQSVTTASPCVKPKKAKKKKK